jgi:DNA/RNA endonuclease G (NUC1)
MWSFILPNEETKKQLTDFRVPTTQVEDFNGILLWERLPGRKVANKKKRVRSMWKT